MTCSGNWKAGVQNMLRLHYKSSERRTFPLNLQLSDKDLTKLHLLEIPHPHEQFKFLFPLLYRQKEIRIGKWKVSIQKSN